MINNTIKLLFIVLIFTNISAYTMENFPKQLTQKSVRFTGKNNRRITSAQPNVSHASSMLVQNQLQRRNSEIDSKIVNATIVLGIIALFYIWLKENYGQVLM